MKKKSFLFGLGVICLLGSIAFALTNSGWPYASQIWPGVGSKRNIVQFALGAVAAGGNSGFYPGVTNTNPLGSSSLRFSNVYTTLLNVSGASTLTGAITASGGMVASAPFRIPTLDVTVSSPSANIGDMCVTSAGIVYVSTEVAGFIVSWKKVGTQT
jgi:hypothetical protein